MSAFSHTLPSWWPWLAAVWLVLAVALGLVFIRRPHRHLSTRTRFLLWSLRAAASAVVLVLILNWSSETTRQTDEKPLIHILADRSASMAGKDAPGGLSRYAYAKHAADIITGLTPRTIKSYFTSDLEGGSVRDLPDGDQSAVGQALFRALDANRQQAIGGVVVLSDFAASDEAALKETLQMYRAAKVPVYPWVIGTEHQPPDIRLVSARLTQPSPSQPNLRLEAAIESPSFAGQEVSLRVSYADQRLVARTVTLTGAHQAVSLDFPSPYRGLHFYEIELGSLPDEVSTNNNSLRAACELRRDPIRVIYMEGSVPAETGYLKDALEADQDMEVACLHLPTEGYSENPEKAARDAAQWLGKDTRIFMDAKGRPVPSVCHISLGFPTNMAGVLNYDVVILSDIVKEAFTPEQVRNMVAFVEEFGGGFVMVGGATSFGAGGWEKTPVDKIMPIEVSNRSDPLWMSGSSKLKVKLPIGPLHPIMQVADNPEETRAAWESFPGFRGINYVKRPKPGAVVIARTSYGSATPSPVLPRITLPRTTLPRTSILKLDSGSPRAQPDPAPGAPTSAGLARTETTGVPVDAGSLKPNEFGAPEEISGYVPLQPAVSSYDDLVLFSVQQIGRGRTMAFCSDTTVDWGTEWESIFGPGGRNNLYFAKFWNNAIRWLAADRIARKKGQTALQVSSPQCVPGSSVHLSIPAAFPSELSFLELSVSEPGLPLEYLPVTWNNGQHCWEAHYAPRLTGDVRFEASYRNAEGNEVKLDAGVFVASAANESVAVGVRPDLAAEIARETGGQLLTEANAAAVFKDIARKSVSTTWKGREPVWNSPWLLLTLCVLIMTEWLLRRRKEPVKA